MIRIDHDKKKQVTIKFVYSGKEFENADWHGLPNAFDASFLQSFPLFGHGDDKVLLVGLGKYQLFERNMSKEALAKGVKELRDFGFTEFNVDLLPLLKKCGLNCLWDVVEGITLGLYTPKSYKNEEKEITCEVSLQGIEPKDLLQAEQCLQHAQSLADSVILARDLVNAPANKLTPEKMADAIADAGKIDGLSVQVFNEDEITQFGMQAYLTVAASSANPPRLIVMRYMGDSQSEEITALVGKGVTCDTGGYCLKGSSTMLGIKGDMAGGAAVAGTLRALAKNKVKANVVGIIPSCENRISPDSFIPGDVISSMSGKTIEVVNTDAEGRLLLADAVTYAVKQEKATRVCDVATLTGAVVGALGFTTAGALTNDEQVWQQFKQAFQTSGEKYWRLPIFDEHRKMIESRIADVKNIGESYCGTITAAAFIEAFAEQRPWIHLDIAGTAWVDKPVFQYQSVGATGAAVTTMYFLLDRTEL